MTGVDHPDYVHAIKVEEATALSAGYTAYYGAYDIDETKKTVTHHVEADLDPDSIGRTRIRFVEFLAEDRILLKYPYRDGREDSLIWERERP